MGMVTYKCNRFAFGWHLVLEERSQLGQFGTHGKVGKVGEVDAL